MIRNYVEVALRGMFRHKLFALINLLGLAVGLASVILIGLYVDDELSYDRYHEDADRLYRISRDFYPGNNTEEMYLATNAAPAAALLQADFPEIEQTARVYGGRVLLGREDISFYEDAVQFVDSAFLDMFSFEWVAGDPDTALAQPFNIVLTESAVRQYFGDTDPLGLTLELENALPLTVTGVIRDLPGNTHLSVSVLASIEPLLNLFGEQARSSWTGNNYHTYIKLAPGAAIETVSEGLPGFVERHIGEGASNWTGMSAIAITDIHLHSTYQSEMKPSGSMANVIALVTVAAGILVIACFNFMNLATALSVLRSREVGVRKSIGAQRGQLILQYLGESLGMTLLATLGAVMFVELLMPALNGFTGKALDFDLLSNSRLQLGLLVLVLLVGCGAGAYPALYLSAFNPVQVLKSQMNRSAGSLVFRNVLVVLQFSISIILVIVTTVVLLQTSFVRDRDPGFTQEQVVILNGPPTQGVTDRWSTLREELSRHPDIVSLTASNLVPGMENLNYFGVRLGGDSEVRDMAFLFVDHGFFETFEVPLLSGRSFSEDFPADRIELPVMDGTASGADISPLQGNFVLNASAVRDLGLSPGEVINREIEFIVGDHRVEGRVVGVAADSNFESLHYGIKPTVFIQTPAGLWSNQYPTLASASVRISGGNFSETLGFIDETWNRVIPEFPVSRSFLSDRMEALYQEESRLGQLFSYFSVLAMIIACLGLFGLATFNAQRRVKEVGIRKVMGGSVWSIVLLLTNDFSKLVLISNVIAWPLAYVAMNRWLENFAYRIDLTPLIFIGSGLIALCIAWVTVGGTAARAASAKPVLALRYE